MQRLDPSQPRLRARYITAAYVACLVAAVSWVLWLIWG